MASGVAHDFNNLLMVVLSGVDLARRQGGLTRSMLEVLDDVHDAAERSAQLTRRLLSFARNQKGAPRVLNLAEAVEGSQRLLKRLAGDSVRLELCPGPACDVHLDPAHLDQVLTNLVVNARDAATADAVVSISTAVVELPAAEAKRRGLAAGRWATLTVQDNGPGLSVEAREHLFEPFFTTKPEGKGTGLGLTTVLALVRQAEGDVTVESEPGRGARFTVWLPAARRR
jgi:signal transduction histidine kinase